MDQFFFLFLDLAFLFNHLHEGHQLFFGHRRRLFDFSGNFRNEVQKNHDGAENDGAPINGIDDHTGDKHAVPGGDGFGDHFAEDQNEKGHDQRYGADGVAGR